MHYNGLNFAHMWKTNRQQNFRNLNFELKEMYVMQKICICVAPADTT